MSPLYPMVLLSQYRGIFKKNKNGGDGGNNSTSSWLVNNNPLEQRSALNRIHPGAIWVRTASLCELEKSALFSLHLSENRVNGRDDYRWAWPQRRVCGRVNLTMKSQNSVILYLLDTVHSQLLTSPWRGYIGLTKGRVIGT